MQWFDINQPFTDQEDSLLHLSAQWEDSSLMDWALSNSADPNVKNKKQKRPFEVQTKTLQLILVLRKERICD